MHDYRKLSQLMERTIHKYIQVEKIKRPYGTDMMLSRVEIHTISAVGDYPDINITSLAKLQGITKGAASQMIYKLVDKGLVEKRVSPNSDTEVCLTLTNLGKTAYESHKKYHETANEKFFEIMKEMPEEVEQQYIKVLEVFEQALDKRLEK